MRDNESERDKKIKRAKHGERCKRKRMREKGEGEREREREKENVTKVEKTGRSNV